MISNNSAFLFTNTGSQVYKLNMQAEAKEKFLWTTKDEIRWSNSIESVQNYSKIAANMILSVWTQEKGNRYLLVIETMVKTYKFQFVSSQVREKWHESIKYLISTVSTGFTRGLTKKKSTILGEKNQEDSSTNQKQGIENLMNVLKQYSKYCKQTWDENNLSSVPQYLEAVITSCNDRKWELQEEAQKHLEENDPKKLACKISMLRKRLKMMEVENQSSNQLDNLSVLIDKEKEQNEYLLSKIEEAHIEKSKAFKEWSSIKDELELAQEMKVSIQNHSDSRSFDRLETMKRVLQKGFICYICTLASPDLIDSLTLTPRRGYEEGIYKKRQVRLSMNNDCIIWKAVGLFTKKTFSLNLNDICTIIEGTEDHQRFEPFDNYTYISIVAKGLTVMMCIENYYGCYLDSIKELYLNINSLPSLKSDMNPLQILRVASEQLQNQILSLSRMCKRYKNTLIDSICAINVKSDKYQEFFYSEIQQLKTMNENLPMGIAAADSETYLRNEKKNLCDRLIAIKKFKSEALLAKF